MKKTNMHKKIIEFWFEEIDPSKWWVKDESFDQLLRDRYLGLHAQANRCELYEWRQTPLGRLAEIIVLDQFSRNMFRDTAESFSSDSLALALAQEAVSIGIDKELDSKQKSFLYMPYMHSESLKIHQQAVILYDQEGMENNLEFEYKHKQIIEQFGRYPHRNEILERISTGQELSFLQQPGSSF
jgi:uncharacterized protein (DUF924 family)